MTTALGKELRKLRIDNEERLAEMSARIGKSAAFISAVEVGKKAPPARFEELVIQAYGLADEAAQLLRAAADRSRQTFTIRAQSELERDTAGMMARRMHSLSEHDLKSIFQILESGGKGEDEQ